MYQISGMKGLNKYLHDYIKWVLWQSCCRQFLYVTLNILNIGFTISKFLHVIWYILPCYVKLKVYILQHKKWPLYHRSKIILHICSLIKATLILFFFFFWFGFYGPFKNISLILTRLFIKGGGKPENPGTNHLTIRKQNLAFPHVTRARPEPQRWET